MNKRHKHNWKFICDDGCDKELHWCTICGTIRESYFSLDNKCNPTYTYFRPKGELSLVHHRAQVLKAN